MRDPAIVKLSWAEMLIAGNAGVLRQVNALKRRLHDPDAHHRDPLEAHVQGAMAEWALAKWLNVHWEPTVGICWAGDVPGDVAGVEVRSTIRPNGSLIVHDYSFDARSYVLALIHQPSYQFVGWVSGAEGKQARYWRQDAPRPAYFVPQADLRPMEELRCVTRRS